ncbi:hypothetical protein IFM46972_00255 [Aspergillus udagawae]|uniref:Uncharacterized protein n=1 Tax=Aspergillus udagawae TaxID=91492 RepID=A0A8H3N4L4_9EURO|nr:hypothetical protein IFM46972_00255 [Aspergillus udagawae]
MNSMLVASRPDHSPSGAEIDTKAGCKSGFYRSASRSVIDHPKVSKKAPLQWRTDFVTDQSCDDSWLRRPRAVSSSSPCTAEYRAIPTNQERG